MLALPLVLGFLWWRTARVPATFYLWLATVGRSEAAYQQASAAFVADFTREPQRRVIQAAMRRLHAHLAAGDRVYIVTAANESLAKAIWAALDGPSRTEEGRGGEGGVSTRRSWGSRYP